MKKSRRNNAGRHILMRANSSIAPFLRGLFFTLMLTTLSVSVVAQKVSLNAQQAKLENVLASISKQTGLSFAYSKQVVNLERRIDLSLFDAELNTALDRLVAGTNLGYEIKNGKIYLFEKPANNAQAAQQRKKISGVILDPSGEPVIGANIVERGTTNGVTSDLDGNFSLDISPNGSLQVSYIGFITETVPVGNRSSLQITLQEDAQALEEVVVVGYGTMEKRHISSSISSIRGDKLIQGIGGATVATALQGRVSSLTISGTSSPNSSAGFQLRGLTSVNAGKGPLVVIDGVPGGDIRSLNQEDILSVDVLKDASAGAIYGTRAAGGVILLVTRQAQEGPLKINYTAELSTESVRKKPDILSAEEFLENDLGQDYGARTDWYDELLNDSPFSHRHVLNLSGGSKQAKIYATFMAQNQKGIAIGDGRKDYSGRINAIFNLFDGIAELKTHTEYRTSKRDQRFSNGTLNMAMKLNPTIAVFDPESDSGYNVTDNIAGKDFNPVADIMLRERGGTDKWLLADATLKVNLLPQLQWFSTIGYQGREWQATRYVSAFHRESIDNSRRGSGYHGFSKNEDLLFDTYLNFQKTWKDHSLNAVAGYSFQEFNGESFNMTNSDFPVNGIGAWDMKTGTYLKDGRAEMESGKDPRERLIAFFGRANYSYQDRYLLTASVRHEGSSKFGPNHKWGTFWAISGGWRLSNEGFMKDIVFINDLKLRVGYGVTGNNNFSAGRSTRMYKSNGLWLTDGKWDYVYGSAHNVNKDLKWEEKAELNVGVDYTLFNNRLFGKFDVYTRKVNDLLFEKDAPQPPMVHDKIMSNIGSLKNKGWEFEIGGTPVQNKDFSYTTTMRLSSNKTELTSIGDISFIAVPDQALPSPGNPGNPYRLENGLEIGQYYLKKFAGFDDNGEWLVYDKDDHVIPATDSREEDKRYMGNAMPDLMISWDHTFVYKNFDLSVFLRSWIGQDVFNLTNMYYGLPPKSTDENVLKTAITENKHIKGEKQLTDYWLEDGSFLKIDAITLGYNLNLRKYHKFLDKARFYLTIRDLACFTSYSGLDPEVDINGLAPGMDWHTKDAVYPKTRRFTLGVQLSF